MPSEFSAQDGRQMTPLYTCIAIQVPSEYLLIYQAHVVEVYDRLKSMLVATGGSGVSTEQAPDLDNVLARCEASGGMA